MKAMVLEKQRAPLHLRDVPVQRPGEGEILVKVAACAVCRTDLHVVDGDLHEPKLPLVPGHEIIGRIEALGPGAQDFKVGERVGVPWLGWTCGQCAFCRAGRENLCERARFTGYTIDGGFAEYARADHRYVFRVPDSFGDVEAAPLMCAGLIGFRSYNLVREAKRIGLYGFGAAAHIIAQVALHEGKEIFAFTKPGDLAGQSFARRLGAAWAGSSEEPPPAVLDAAIIFAPVGALVPQALKAIAKGGTLVCAGIHMSDIPGFPYRDLWGERVIRSVANLTRADGDAFLALAPKVPVRTTTRAYPLEQANEALADLRVGAFEGAGVLVTSA